MASGFQSDAFQGDAFQGGEQRTASDTVSSSDSVAQQSVFVRTASDTATTSDAITSARGAARTVDDTTSVSDSTTEETGVAYSVTASDTVTGVDSLSRVRAVLVTATDGVSSIQSLFLDFTGGLPAGWTNNGLAVVSDELVAGPGEGGYIEYDGVSLPGLTTLEFDLRTPDPIDDDYWNLEIDTYGRYVYIDNWWTDLGTTFGLYVDGGDVELSALIAGETYHVKAELESADGGVQRAKVWLASDPEPPGWDIDVTEATGGAYPFAIFMSSEGAGTLAIDNAQWTVLGSSTDSVARIYGGVRVIDEDLEDLVEWVLPYAAQVITPDPPPVPGGTGPYDRPASFSIGGVNMGPFVDYKRTRLSTYANGNVGTGEIWVKDVDGVVSFATGEEVVVRFRGVRVFGGYIARVRRAYAFPGGTGTDDEPRYLVLEVVDYNILLRKRIYFDDTDPTKMQVRTWPNGTPDNTVVGWLVSRNLTLSGDNLSFDIHHVGTPALITDSCNPDAPDRFQIGSAGWTWGEAMASVTSQTGAIYYIDPDKVFRYVDDSTKQSAFGYTGLSDDPGGAVVGYRDLEIVSDGSKLVNEQFTWGVGQGATAPVLGHKQSDASIAEHGLWQQGELRYDMYCQESVSRRAESWLVGSPQNRRGYKDDKIVARCTVFHPYFRVADVVSLASTSFGFTDTVPVRGAEITFPTPWDIQCVLTISHEIDTPWNTYEFAFPRFGGEFPPLVFPPLVFPPWPVFDGLPGIPPFDACGGCIDDFAIDTTDGWGIGNLGIWTDNGIGSAYVLDGVARFDDVGSAGGFVSGWMTVMPNTFTDLWTRVRIDRVSGSGRSLASVYVRNVDGPLLFEVGYDASYFGGSAAHALSLNGSLTTIKTGEEYFGNWFNLRVNYNGSVVSAKMWLDGEAEPEDWIATDAPTNGGDVFRLDVRSRALTSSTVWNMGFDFIQISPCNGQTTILNAAGGTPDPVAFPRSQVVRNDQVSWDSDDAERYWRWTHTPGDVWAAQFSTPGVGTFWALGNTDKIFHSGIFRTPTGVTEAGEPVAMRMSAYRTFRAPNPDIAAVEVAVRIKGSLSFTGYQKDYPPYIDIPGFQTGLVRTPLPPHNFTLSVLMEDHVTVYPNVLFGNQPGFQLLQVGSPIWEGTLNSDESEVPVDVVVNLPLDKHWALSLQVDELVNTQDIVWGGPGRNSAGAGFELESVVYEFERAPSPSPTPDPDPCVAPGDAVCIETFTRSVTDGLGLSEAPGGTWTDSGYFGVDGDEMVVQRPDPLPSPAYTLLGAGAAMPFEILFTARWEKDFGVEPGPPHPPGPPPTDPAYAEAYGVARFVLDAGGGGGPFQLPYEYVEFRLNRNSNTLEDYVSIPLAGDGPGPSDGYSTGGFVPNLISYATPFKVRWRVEETAIRLKVWEASASEPVGWDQEFDKDLLAAGYPRWAFNVSLSNESPASIGFVEGVRLYITSYEIIEPCAGDNVLPGELADPSGEGVQYGTQPVVGVIELPNGNFLYTFAQQFQPGSSEVWANGKRLRLNDDYTEHALEAAIEIHSDALVGTDPFDPGMVISANLTPWLIQDPPPEFVP